MYLFCFLIPALTLAAINPYPRQVVKTETLTKWVFTNNLQGFTPAHDCKLSAKNSRMFITATGADPYLISPPINLKGPFIVKLRLKDIRQGPGQIFWISDTHPQWQEEQSTRFDIKYDPQWQDYEVYLSTQGTVQHIRLDPGTVTGTIEVEFIEIIRAQLHPLELQQIKTNEKQITLQLHNHDSTPLNFTVDNKQYNLAARQDQTVTLDSNPTKTFASRTITIKSPNLPEIQRNLYLYHPSAKLDGVVLKSGDLTLIAARDGSGAQIKKADRLVAVIAPLVHFNDTVPQLKLIESNNAINFSGPQIKISFTLKAPELSIAINSEIDCEGPVLRALGNLEQGLFAGLEYLGKGELSSSKLDIETKEHLRFAPDRLKVTMPLMSCATDLATVAMTWQDMHLQPVFAAPNFLDGSNDHRMALRGKYIQTNILVNNTSLEETILWAVNKQQLPDLPNPPRTWPQQKKICMDSLNGPLHNKNGWGHCAEDHWARHPFADQASTIWRLTGKAPNLEKITPGGAHIPNDAIYFVTGRANEWLQHKKNQIRSIIQQQKPDGSFRYNGKFQKGHFEDTASGFCAQHARDLLEIAYLTGDKDALAAGVKTLEFMKRFRTPRGAQTWEVPLHTPDILASAYLVWSYVRGYELTGNQEYLDLARKWALSGVPFVYLWGEHPIMTYATIAVYGATNWVAPNWMGMPVQWCGLVYAYPLTLLAPYDNTLNWNKLANGILIAGEQMQYPDGKFIGTLPDSLEEIRSQKRQPWNINPCPLISIHLRLSGQVDSLAVAASGKNRITSPFPIEIQDGQAFVTAPQDTQYQVLINGEKIINLTSRGKDIIALDE